MSSLDGYSLLDDGHLMRSLAGIAAEAGELEGLTAGRGREGFVAASSPAAASVAARREAIEQAESEWARLAARASEAVHATTGTRLRPKPTARAAHQAASLPKAIMEASSRFQHAISAARGERRDGNGSSTSGSGRPARRRYDGPPVAALERFHRRLVRAKEEEESGLARLKRDALSRLRRRVEELLGGAAQQALDEAAAHTDRAVASSMSAVAVKGARQLRRWLERVKAEIDSGTAASQQRLQAAFHSESERLLLEAAAVLEAQREADLDAEAERLVTEKDSLLAELQRESQAELQEALAELRRESAAETAVAQQKMQEEAEAAAAEAVAAAHEAAVAETAAARSELEAVAASEQEHRLVRATDQAVRLAEAELSAAKTELERAAYTDVAEHTAELQARLRAEHASALETLRRDLRARTAAAEAEARASVAEAHCAELDRARAEARAERAARVSDAMSLARQEAAQALQAERERLAAETEDAVGAVVESERRALREAAARSEAAATEAARGRLDALRAAVAAEAESERATDAAAQDAELGWSLREEDARLRAAAVKRAEEGRREWEALRRRALSVMRALSEAGGQVCVPEEEGFASHRGAHGTGSGARSGGASKMLQAAEALLREAEASHDDSDQDEDGDGDAADHERRPARRTALVGGTRLAREVGLDDVSDDEDTSGVQADQGEEVSDVAVLRSQAERWLEQAHRMQLDLRQRLEASEMARSRLARAVVVLQRKLSTSMRRCRRLEASGPA